MDRHTDDILTNFGSELTSHLMKLTRKPLRKVVPTDVEHAQESDESFEGSDVRKVENLVGRQSNQFEPNSTFIANLCKINILCLKLKRSLLIV